MAKIVGKRTLGILLILILVISLIVPAMGTEYPGMFYGPYFIGARWFSGVGVPSNTNGLEGDYYFDTSGTGNIYNKTSSAWQLLGSVIGPTGPGGAPGAPGAPGPAGPTSPNAVFSGEISIDGGITIWNGTDGRWVTDSGTTIAALVNGLNNQIQTNRSDVLAEADSHILTNLSTVSTAQAVLIADRHIQSNRSETILELENQFAANDTSTANSILNSVKENRSVDTLELENQFHMNDSATLRTADDHISSNLSTSANLLAADLHIASNRTDILTATWANGTIFGNTSAGLLLAGNLIASNKTDIFTGVHTNESALLRTADDHISTNSSAATNLLAADLHIASNRTDILTATWMNLTIWDQHIASNKTDIFSATVTNLSADRLTLQNEIASNKTDAISAASSNLTLYKGYSSNFTFMAQSLIPEAVNGPTEVAPNTTGMTNGPLNWVSLDFAASPQQNVTVGYIMPSDWDGLNLAANFWWTSTGGGGTVTWQFRGFCGLDNARMNAPWGAPQTITDTVQSINFIHVSSFTAATTMGGTLDKSGRNFCFFQFSRNGGTLSTPASLLGVQVDYGAN